MVDEAIPSPFSKLIPFIFSMILFIGSKALPLVAAVATFVTAVDVLVATFFFSIEPFVVTDDAFNGDLDGVVRVSVDEIGFLVGVNFLVAAVVVVVLVRKVDVNADDGRFVVLVVVDVVVAPPAVVDLAVVVFVIVLTGLCLELKVKKC